MNDTSTTQVFAENGRKGISYDWQSLLVSDLSNDTGMSNDTCMSNDTLASLRELDLELATSF
jgi:hypothetical protein